MRGEEGGRKGERERRGEGRKEMRVRRVERQAECGGIKEKGWERGRGKK